MFCIENWSSKPYHDCVCTVGEANSGRASKGLATYSSGIGQVQDSASSAMSEIGQAKRVSMRC